MAAILVVNAGSSSIKFSMYAVKDGTELALVSKGQIDGIGSTPRLRAVDGRGAKLVDQSFGAGQVPDVPAAMVRVSGWLRGITTATSLSRSATASCTGGPAFRRRSSSDEVLAGLERLVPLAPLHQPYSIQPMRAVQARLPGTLQVACFDTAFHRGHPEVADRYALSDDLYREGVRRYGFHGLSYEYIVHRLRTVAPELARGRVVIAHLGSGASMCAVQDGQSMDSSMGFTALDGLPMGTRCGQLDPGVVLYLVAEKGYGSKGSRAPSLPRLGTARALGPQQRRARAPRESGPESPAGPGLLHVPSGSGLAALAGALEGSTASCSRRASARTRRRSASASAPAPRGSGCIWTPPRTVPAARASAPSSRASPRG